MRRWFVLLLIALLPLRGMIGDAMAADMMAKHLATAQSAVETETAHHGMDPDCMGHSHADADEGSSAANDASPCPTCASCQVCSSVALAFAVSVDVSPAFAQPRPISAQAMFISADPATGFKPPIS